jgi:glycine/D-amino acid oxidase-like deaminating enzyme
VTAYDWEVQGDRARLERSFRWASAVPYWLDSPLRPAPEPPLAGDTTADLLVVGGGYCGLWTALLAKEADPGLGVVVVESREVGWAASGRNGGFVEASLTHGRQNGRRYFADQLDVLDRLGAENLDGIEETLTRHGIDAEFERTGMLTVATEEHQVAALRALHGDFHDRHELQRLVRSPLFRAGVLQHDGVALAHPAKLAWGLKRTLLRLGVRIHEDTPVVALTDEGSAVRASTPAGTVRAPRVVLATNGFPSLLRRNRLLTLPVYDYALMTEPLTDAQLADIGWTGRFGMSDSARQFHYYRKSADNRILWGGYDVVYHRGGRLRAGHEQRPETFLRLADHFAATFPQLAGIQFTHAWGGMIDMSARLVAHHGTAMGGKVSYSSGFTGLGVAATRFAGLVMLDLLAGRDTERTRLPTVRSRPLPVPPEPLAYPLVQLMRRAIADADRRGRDGLLIRMADRLGFTFDS